MQTVALTWQQSGEVAGTLGLIGAGLRVAHDRRANKAAPFVLEAAMIAFLYGLWQLCGKLSVTGTADGMRRARWIEHFEHDVFLPSERSVQKLILGHRLIVQTANLYYDTMHFTMLFVFLIWMFVRHRDQYRRVRTTLALTTLACLLVQLIPVAPPRMLPGFVDTAALYGQSVYSNGIAADQLSAMPSVHVAWAVLIGYYVVRVSPSRWRWIAALHSALTIFIVVATANHWWLDGIVGVTLLVLCAWLNVGVRALVKNLQNRRRDAAPIEVREPEAVLG
ncbi:phosphatase PAP2 family protein [Jatrophihabitans sp.]|uniref:phosphatase PAP2 family protein n=1 Tax=Jatrophihabitans sp. TaxID=1932789 RepID=UPI0030C70AB7|nr:inositol phosphorylceramide synthase [Jatrophihabitans sp.]